MSFKTHQTVIKCRIFISGSGSVSRACLKHGRLKLVLTVCLCVILDPWRLADSPHWCPPTNTKSFLGFHRQLSPSFQQLSLLSFNHFCVTVNSSYPQVRVWHINKSQGTNNGCLCVCVIMTNITRFSVTITTSSLLLIKSILLLGFGHHVLDICIWSDENVKGGEKKPHTHKPLCVWGFVAVSRQTKGHKCSSARRFIQICDHEGCEDQLNLLCVNLAVPH